MSRAELIYPIRKQIERQLSLIESDPHNRDILLRYYKVRTTQVRLTTVLAEFVRLNLMSRMLKKKFGEATIQDLEDLIFKINQRNSNPNTQNKFRKVLKAFYRWMKGYSKGEFPQEVKWITLNKIPIVTVKPEDLLSYEECLTITEFATNLRDKALFQCLLDAGCRIGEILPAKIGEAEFNDAGAVIYGDGKTGNQPCILTWSAVILATWLNNHPFRKNKEAPLWPLLDRKEPEQLSYAAVRKAFSECVARSGCKRRVWIHLFRHVSSSEDARLGMPDSYRRYKHHWTPDSRMPKVYEHLSQSIIPNIQNATWKVLTGSSKVENENVEKKQQLELTRKCKRCEYENPRDSMFCNRCAFPLDEKKAAEITVVKSKIDELLNKLTEDPEKLDKLLALLN